MIFLDTARLLFRSHQIEDEDDFIAMHTDPEVRRYVGGRAWPVEEAVRRFRKGYVGHPNETYGMWATIFKADGKYIGCCGLNSTDNGSRVALGYFIARPYWGRGLASEASKAFLDLGFNRLRLAGITADVQKGHAVSEHILQKFGFHFVSEELIPASGRIISLYELTQSEWQNLNP
jgi:ribosomal-protein-alanine N-acetyltransferase